jgi:hypothetical protein
MQNDRQLFFTVKVITAIFFWTFHFLSEFRLGYHRDKTAISETQKSW